MTTVSHKTKIKYSLKSTRIPFYQPGKSIMVTFYSKVTDEQENALRKSFLTGFAILFCDSS